jgi:transcriptional regulator with XRE-family HTH domain
LEKNNYDSTIGLKISIVRVNKGITQVELGKLAKVSKAYISHIETGHKLPSFRMINRISRALGVSWKDIAVSPILDKVKAMNISPNEKNNLYALIDSLADIS